MTEEKSKFLFSIIVPVYNTEKYVEKTLKSIYEAMDRECEVIVVNDGSKDNSEEIIKKFINALPEEYKNNFVYVKKDNKGLADTKNVGIAKARGEFISVVDSDDYIDKNFYKIAREYVKDIAKGIKEKDEEITELISKNLKTGWTIDRISTVDLSLLKLAIYEIKYGEIPYKIAINEAVNLAKKYGEEQSSSFVNGILAKVVE